MNLYDKIRNAECEMPESFCMTIGQVLELIDNSPSEDDLVWTAFKFGYMQGKRAEQISKTNKANGNRTESEADRLRENIDRILNRLNVGELKGVDVFLCTLFEQEVLNERSD